MAGLTTDWQKSTRSNGATSCVEARWKKSTRSNGANGCVEATWKASTRSGGNGCVEAREHGGRVEFRDSKDPSGPILSFPADAHLDFLSALKSGALDRP